MSDSTYISEAAALRILRQDGDFTDIGARAVLSHSRKQSMGDAVYYPMNYIYKRARANAARPEPDAWGMTHV
jgi:hypothetical protein